MDPYFKSTCGDCLLNCQIVSTVTCRYEYVAKKDPEVIYIYWGQSGKLLFNVLLLHHIQLAIIGIH